MQLLDGNRLTLLESGAAFFPALEAAIASARHEVYLETYISPTTRPAGASSARSPRRPRRACARTCWSTA
jgi:cardiolipin synthase